MPCVNHPEAVVQSYCQNCGKALCTACVRTTPTGQVLCETCAVGWQSFQQPYVPPVMPGAPNPAAAAILGLIPGVGAMYNGQLFKGLIHVVVFAVLVSITDHVHIFGLFVAAWVLYQSFEAFHTAKARRDGLPVPDPFGLNELGSWLNLGGLGRTPDPSQPFQPGQPGATATGTGTPYPSGSSAPPPYSAPYAGSGSWTASGGYQPPYGQPGQPAGQPTYQEPFVGAEGYPPGTIPPIPPIPPVPGIWRRKEPVWAIVLIVLGIIFLLQSMGFVADLFRYAWPLLLIGIGVWLIVRRLGYARGGSK